MGVDGCLGKFLILKGAWTTINYTDAVYDEQASRFSARCHMRGPAGVSMA
jgi:hypothetical protein